MEKKIMWVKSFSQKLKTKSTWEFSQELWKRQFLSSNNNWNGENFVEILGFV